MGKFKFFQNKPENNSHPITHRQYFGLTRGRIRWVDLPIVQVSYLGAVETIHDNTLMPEIRMDLFNEVIILETFWVNTLLEFESQNQNNYILILNLQDVQGNMYDQTSRDRPYGGPLMVRGKTFS
jgi:hypothetical protein